ncbi:MAG: 1-acyl-sn-glycerol-3-phosphate acyltransferase [Actinomycetota bacterium]|nr:1-acyl-sn-glycerol-3-phosphate acyltransferase [Actinomycetota bacterium]
MSLPVPPRWVRRLVLAPLAVLGVALLLTTVPVLLVVAVVASAFLPGTWRGLRLLAFALVYALIEFVGLVVLFAAWLGSGFGTQLHRDRWVSFHYAVLGVSIDVLVRAAMRLFHLRIALETDVQGHHAGQPERLPAIVASRHAGPGDSFLLVHGLLRRWARRPRIVLKNTLQLDPFIDVLLNRLPTRFIDPSAGAGDAVVAAIGDLAESMGRDDALVIFPEGGNFTPRRRVKAIDRLRTSGRDALAEQAEQLRYTLPPRPSGIAAAIRARPEARVILVAHTGLDHMDTLRDVWRGLPQDKTLAVRWVSVAPDDVAPGSDTDAIGQALMSGWLDMDAWIARHRDDPTGT